MSRAEATNDVAQPLSENDFLAVLRDDVGLDVDASDLRRPLDEVVGWDSLYLLTVATIAEKQSGLSVSFPDLLLARSLADVRRALGGNI